MAKQRTGSLGGLPPAPTNDDDASVFRAAVRDVKPLPRIPQVKGLAKPRPQARLRKTAPVMENLDEAMPLIGMPLRGTSDEVQSGISAGGGGDAALSFQRSSVRTQVVRRLRRGLIPLEAELDLHGLSQAAARDQLVLFLAHQRDRGTRCVRIIHGKGYRSGARGPVLKVAVDLWLRRHSDVLAFTSARAIDGGTGAMYVLLRA